MNIAVRTRESRETAANAGQVALIECRETHPVAAALGDVADFAECCEVHAWYYAEGWISLQTAADNLQHLAERWALIDEIGQDAVQRMIAYERTPEPPELSEYEIAYGQRIIMQWEAADAARSRPAAAKAPDRYHPAASTVDAFWHVISLKDPDKLSGWLRDHPRDTARLLKLLEAK